MGIVKRIKGRCRLPESRGVWVALSIILPLAEIALLVIFFRDDLSSGKADVIFISNFVLGIAASSALPLAIWRGIVADSQASAAQRQTEIAQQQEEKAQQQVDIAQRQADTAQQGLRNERYQKGAEMLGSEVLSVRMGGIYALQRLAKEHPEEYHIQIMRLLCAFVRRPTPDKDYEAELYNNLRGKVHHNIEGPIAREDVQGAMQAIGTRGDQEVELEKDQEFQLDLSHARLRHMTLRYLNLYGANLYNTDLFDAILVFTDLTSAWLSEATLSKAKLLGTILSGSTLIKARVSGTIFTGVQGFTQGQLNHARRLDPGEEPPFLEEAFDTLSGEQLEWKGGI